MASPSRAGQLGRPLPLALLLLASAASLLTGCGKRPQPEPPATPVLATVRIESLVREHPAFPELQRLRRLSAAASAAVARPDSAAVGQQLRQKAETSPPHTDSKTRTPGDVPPPLSEGERTVAGIPEDARAMKQEHERFREAQMPSKAPGDFSPLPEGLSSRQAASDVRLHQRQLASILRRETVDACRHIGVQHGIELKLPPHVPEEAVDMTGSFRRWLREYWQKAEPGPQAREGGTGQ